MGVPNRSLFTVQPVQLWAKESYIFDQHQIQDQPGRIFYKPACVFGQACELRPANLLKGFGVSHSFCCIYK